MHDGAMQQMRRRTDDLVAAARKRLELWDIGDAQIDAVRAHREDRSRISRSYSPVSGFVIERNAFPRQRVTADTAALHGGRSFDACG